VAYIKSQAHEGWVLLANFPRRTRPARRLKRERIFTRSTASLMSEEEAAASVMTLLAEANRAFKREGRRLVFASLSPLSDDVEDFQLAQPTTH
jgi:hypothetical protein